MVTVKSHIMIVPEVHPGDYVKILANDRGVMNAAIQQYCKDIMMIWGSRKSQLMQQPILIPIANGVLDDVQVRLQIVDKLMYSFVPTHASKWTPPLAPNGSNWRLSPEQRLDGRYYLDEALPPTHPQHRYCRSYFEIQHKPGPGEPVWDLTNPDPQGWTSLLKKLSAGNSSVRVRLLATLEHDFF